MAIFEKVSFLATRVRPDPGKYQWVQGKCTGIDRDEAERTHLIGIPPLMPGTIIFVHGVNSEGEWYGDAAAQFCEGLKKRLGRTDLISSAVDVNTRRFKVKTDEGKKSHSPIIPFYWGYSVPKDKRFPIVGAPEGYLVDKHFNPLRSDGTWGGGPFQNGTSSLTQFWLPMGFKNKDFVLFTIDSINPIVGRTLTDCPPRLYYAHAARRLANLVATIREDLPNEPINIVAHSQGTMVALCALFYLDQVKVRGPDAVILNSSPYHFDEKITDFLAAAQGYQDVQSEEARVATFKNAAAIVQKAKTEFAYKPAPNADCSHNPEPRHSYDDRIYIRHSPGKDEWPADIGAGDVDADGSKWWEKPKYKREGNRGSLFVNFNPGDRVIGVSAVGGIGWRGLPPEYFGADGKKFGPNVMQRLFARGSSKTETPDDKTNYNPPVGSKTGYSQPYFYSQIEQVGVRSTDGTVWSIGLGGQLVTQDEYWMYLDGSRTMTQWRIASEKMLHLIPALGSVAPESNGAIETVYINAPLVPEAAKLGKDFDARAVRFDGQGSKADDGTVVAVDIEQREDYAEYLLYQQREEVSCDPQHVDCTDDQGIPGKRRETYKEVQQRLNNKGRAVSPTNHAQILRYTGIDGFPVARVLSYDITVGQGYAFGDETYWNYLLDLADWKLSDPYYKSGLLDEKAEAMPPGIDPRTVSPSSASAAPRDDTGNGVAA